MKVLKDNYEEALLNRDEALESVGKLENELKATSAQSDSSVKKEIILAIVKNEAAEEGSTIKAVMNEEILELKKENKVLESLLNQNIVQVTDLNVEVKKLEAVSVTLNKGLVEARTKPATKSVEEKALKVEIKHWRKELGEERRQKMKLEKALSEMEAKLLESVKAQHQQPSSTAKGMLTSTSNTSSKFPLSHV